jgi:heme/copper-type cytochrome/quinol oxidase subunit 3
MILFIASEVMFFVAWFWAYFNSALFPADMHQITREQLFGGVWPPQGNRDLRSLAPSAVEHAHPAHLRNNRDLGASCAAGERPSGAQVGPVI